MTVGASTAVFVALGSNLGDRRANLEGAVEALRETPGLSVGRVSGWHETAPVGGPPGQPAFLNGVLEAECRLSARALLSRLLAVEEDFGRDRTRELYHGPRTLDLDLIFYGEDEIHEADLVVPHPRLEERLFVLEPLARLVPERRLGGCGKSVRARLQELRREAAGRSG